MANEFKACSVEGCNGVHLAHGLCRKHYARLRRNGDPTSGRTPAGEPWRYFTENTLTYEGEDCLIWPYNRGRDGYGRMMLKGKALLVHRQVCEKVHGPPPTPDHHAAHECGNGHEGCVSPKHLSWKTPKENQTDRIAHGTALRGENHGSAKLTESQVAEILSIGDESQASIAKRFGVAQPTICHIKRKKIWSWM